MPSFTASRSAGGDNGLVDSRLCIVLRRIVTQRQPSGRKEPEVANQNHEHDEPTSVGVVAVTILVILALLTGVIWAFSWVL